MSFPFYSCHLVFFVYSRVLPRVSNFPFVSKNYVIACLYFCVISALKSLSDNLASALFWCCHLGDYLFSFELRCCSLLI